MKIEDVKKEAKPERKIVKINLAITPTVSKWLKANSVSPQKVFDLAIIDLQKQEE